MPQLRLANKQLADLLGVLAHPHRIRIVQLLRDGEKDVNTLQKSLGISHSGTSQHLALMRANRLVVERRVGRRVYYRLVIEQLASWLEDGFPCLEDAASSLEEIRRAVKRRNASSPTAEPDSSRIDYEFQLPATPSNREIRRPKHSPRADAHSTRSRESRSLTTTRVDASSSEPPF